MRKPYWLGELEIALIGALILVGVGMAFMALAGAMGGAVPVRVPVNAVPAIRDAVAAGAVVEGGGTVDMMIEHPAPGQIVAGVFATVPTLVVVFTLLAILHRVVRGARRGGPFDGLVVRRLRLLGVITIGGGLLSRIVEIIAQAHLTSTVVRHSGLNFSAPAVFGWLLVGFGFFAVAEIVRRGLAMRTGHDTAV
jgi:hypothetical protein